MGTNFALPKALSEEVSMLTALPRYDELYVVSDIHMGGRPGFQIFHQGARLGRLIRSLTRARPEEPEEEVALVLNGDVIDSLAEDIRGYIAMEDAVSMMDRIYRDPAFSPVWDALAEFVKTRHRSLVIVLGNHDLEMALPHVEYSVRRRLAEGDDAAQGRISFSTRGGGHACRVGKARVLCTHGNEVDDWNAVDYDLLARLASAINADRPVPLSEWTPNPGTRLVVDVMNAVKRKHPFVDLLKPETKAVAPVLLVLDPELVRQVSSVLPILGGKIRGAFKTGKLLSDDSPGIEAVSDSGAAAEVALEQLLGPSLRAAVGEARPRGTLEDELLAVERNFAAGRSSAEPASGETLGWPGMVVDRLRGIDKVQALRRALKDWLEDDPTFDPATRDETFHRVTGRVGKDVDFIVTGHTHLERAIRIDADVDRFYYNCGTWVRLLRFTDRVLSDEAAFADVFDAMSAGRMEELDETSIPGPNGGRDPLILTRSTVVKISSRPEGVLGELCHVGDEGEDGVTLETVAGSKFRRR